MRGRPCRYGACSPRFHRGVATPKLHFPDCEIPVSQSLPYPTSLSPNIAWMLWRTASERPDKTAILAREGTTDYASLRGRAAAFAGALRAAGVGADDRAAVFLERGADAAAAFFGTVAAGGAAILVNEMLRPRQIEHILAHADARVLITSAEMLARQPRRLETAARVIEVAEVPNTGEASPIPRVGSDLAQIIYTSGSTGLPKGVTLCHANLWAGMHAVTQYVGISQEDRIASLLPFSFDYGFNQLLCAVGAGAMLVVERSPMPQQIAQSLREQEVTVLPCVPPLWMQLLGVPGFRGAPLPRLRAMTNTGGHIPTEAVRALREAQPTAKLFLMYGLTEAFRATYLPPEVVDQRPDSIGRAIPGSEIHVLREDLTACVADEVGELVQRGPTVALGYWRDPEATARVFRPNPLRPAGTPKAERVVFSGDLVRRDAEGFLYYVGRRDRMIKTLGYRVSPDEISNVLFASGQIREGVVASEPDDKRGERIVAFVVLAEQGTLERLESFCRVELPRYMQPARIVPCPEILRTTSGKYDVRAMQQAAVP